MTLKNTIDVLAKLNYKNLVDKLLDIINNNEIKKSEKHNKKEDITTSYFKVNLTEDEIDSIIEILQYEQINFVGDGENYDQKFYHYSDLLDNWIV